MRFAFDRQLNSGAFPQAMMSDLSPPVPDPMDARPRSDHRMQRNTEHEFLKLLIAEETSLEGRQLQVSLAQAERDAECIRRAKFLMVVLFMVSLAGLSYCAILMPEVFRNPRLLVVRSLCDLGLASLISLVAFLGYSHWHHTVMNRLHGECRLLVLS